MKTTDRGKKIYEWIKARHAENMTVYATTATHITKIAPKHSDRIRYRNGHCEKCAGKRWDSINYCKITAQIAE